MVSSTVNAARRRRLAVLLHLNSIKKQRAPYAAATGGKRRKHQRIPQVFATPEKPARTWNDYADCLTEKEFRARYKIGKARFQWLVEKLRAPLEKNMNKDTAHPGQPITAEIRVAAGLRWLAGGSWCTESHFLGVGDKWFFKNKTAFVDLLNQYFQKEQLDLVSRLGCIGYLDSIEVSF